MAVRTTITVVAQERVSIGSLRCFRWLRSAYSRVSRRTRRIKLIITRLFDSMTLQPTLSKNGPSGRTRSARRFGVTGKREDAQTRDLLNKFVTMIETTSMHWARGQRKASDVIRAPGRLTEKEKPRRYKMGRLLFHRAIVRRTRIPVAFESYYRFADGDRQVNYLPSDNAIPRSVIPKRRLEHEQNAFQGTISSTYMSRIRPSACISSDRGAAGTLEVEDV